MPRTVVTVQSPAERVREFEDVFGSATVPVKSPYPTYAELPIGRHLVYELDVAGLEPRVRLRLTAHLAVKFGSTPHAVDRELDDVGMPVLAEGCSMMTESLDFLL